MYHKDLEVYKQAIKFVVLIYSITENFPQAEIYGLTNQIRRAAVSIPSNIAEGCARVSDKQLMNFVNICMGSLAEVETQLNIANLLGYIKDCSQADTELNKLKSLLIGFKNHISKKCDIN